MTAPYKEAAFRYLSHGWKGPLPVGDHPKEKAHPPTGFTGNEGAWPDENQIAQWVRSKGDLNIALRLPEHVIGIDVDDYDDKHGADTMIAVTEAHGKLPRTWITTSREGTRSGIRWFRLHQPGKLPGKLHHPDDDNISDVEVIQHTHRYALVPPSVHPQGGTYRWIRPDGTPADNGTIPRPDDLPILPAAWYDHIKKECSCWATGTFDWQRYVKERRDPVVDAYNKWAGRLNTSYGRHDAATGGTMALVAFRQQGWPGAAEKLEQLHQAFLSSVGDSRTAREAEAEWQRMIDGAEKKAANTTIPRYTPPTTYTAPEGTDPKEHLHNLVLEELNKLRVRDQARRLFKAEQAPPPALPEMLTLKERLARPLPPVQWRIEGWQPIGTRVLLAAQFKAGKTTLTGNLARCLVDDQPWLGVAKLTPVVTGHVTILDFEMSERQIDGWLGDQGIQRDDKIVVMPLRGKAAAFDILDDETRTEWAQRLRGTEYLILDCLRPILDALGLDEHKDGGRFLTAFDALCDEAGIDDALVVHHMGHQGERSRGDSRFRDWPDVEWRLVREDDNPASPRYISAYGRDVEQPEGLLEYHPDSRHLTLVGGSRATAEARAALVDVLTLLSESDEPLTQTAIETLMRNEYDHTRSNVRAAIEIGVKNGQIRVENGPNRKKLHSIVNSSRAVRRQTDQKPPENEDQSAEATSSLPADWNPYTARESADFQSSLPQSADSPRTSAPVRPLKGGGALAHSATGAATCSVCDQPGTLIELRGELMHPRCAPRGWEPTPEEIAP